MALDEICKARFYGWECGFDDHAMWSCLEKIYNVAFRAFYVNLHYVRCGCQQGSNRFYCDIAPISIDSVLFVRYDTIAYQVAIPYI